MEALITSFWLGVGAAASPCLLPLYPTVLAMLAGRRSDDSRATWAFLGLAVVLGVVTALTVVGLAVTAVSTSLSGILAWLAVRRTRKGDSPGGVAQAAAILIALLVVVNAIAIWAMTTKPV